jgi:3-oxoadipate enol-lactonase
VSEIVAIESGIVPVDNGTLYYETDGQGHPLVLIHAGFLDRRMWDPQFNLFAKDYQVIRYDVRGFGRSSRAQNKFSDIEDLHALLKHLGVDKAYIIGVSNGGRIAIDFTANFPDMVDALILVGAGVSGYQNSPEETAFWKEFDQQMAPQEELVKQGKLAEAAIMDVDAWACAQDPESRKKIATIALENAHLAVDNPWKLQVRPDPPGFMRLAEIRVPTLVMVGDRDVKGMQMAANIVHSKIPGSKHLVVNGADHILNTSRPDEFNRAVFDFLQELR